jgi:tetratricopeptide (TPR) repeat protein
VAALLLLAALGLAAWGGRHLWAWYHFRAGRSALEADDLEAARRHLNDCLRAWGGSAEAHLLAARAARRADDLDEAERQLSAHERLRGNEEARAFEWAMLKVQEGRVGDVEGYLARAAERKDSPDGLLALEALAKGHLGNRQADRAAAEAGELLRRRPDSFPGLLLHGDAVGALGRKEEALHDYEAAVALRPGALPARLRRGFELEALGRVADALAEYEALRRAEPDHPEVLLALARLRHDCGELDEADALLQRLLDLHPDDAGALEERARIALRRVGLPL